MSTDLAAFLLARYDDEEALALEASWRFSERTATTEPVAAHIARWDPARVLAECEARRWIVELHRIGHDPCDAHDASFESIPCETLEVLALPYSSHPDYDPSWRP